MYIETVIIDSFALAYLAGAVTVRATGGGLQRTRAAFAATVGAALTSLLPHIPQKQIAAVCKLAIWGIEAVILFAGKQRGMARVSLFLVTELAFCGAACVAGLILQKDHLSVFPTLAVWCGCYILFEVTEIGVKKVRAHARNEYAADVIINGQSVRFSAFLDTGNLVFDEGTGLPVLIADSERFTRRLHGDAAVGLARALPAMRSMSISTPAGSTHIFLFRPDKITVYSDRHGHTINAMIGLVASSRKGANKGGKGTGTGTHELLLNPAAMEGVC